MQISSGSPWMMKLMSGPALCGADPPSLLPPALSGCAQGKTLLISQGVWFLDSCAPVHRRKKLEVGRDIPVTEMQYPTSGYSSQLKPVMLREYFHARADRRPHPHCVSFRQGLQRWLLLRCYVWSVKSHHRFLSLNSWFPGSGTVWGDCGIFRP